VSNGCRFREGRFPVISVCLISGKLMPHLAFGEPKEITGRDSLQWTPAVISWNDNQRSGPLAAADQRDRLG
jgi:hypothetical protein